MERKQSTEQSLEQPTKRQPITTALTISLLLFVLTTMLALNQTPRPYPLLEPTAWQSFSLPQEENALLRLPLFSGIIRDLFVVPGTSHVWAVGDNGLVLHSTDDGVSWQRQQLPRVASANGGENAVDTTTNSEAAGTWAAPPQLFAQAIAADAPAAQKTATQPNSNLRLSGTKDVPPDTDAERQYLLEQQQVPAEQKQAPPQQQEILPIVEQPATPPPQRPLPNLNSVWFFDASSGVVAGDSGAIYRTSDGGVNWQLVSAPSYWTIKQLFLAADNKLYAALDSAVIFSSDQGATWEGGKVTRRNVETPVGWLQPSRRNANQPLLIGNRASRYQISDEGEITPFEAGAAMSQFFRYAAGSEEYWLAVGDQGAIALSSQGKLTPINSPTNKLLNYVLMLNNTRALAVGENGTTLETVDAGLTWSTLTPGTEQTLLTLAAINDDIVLAAGSAGTLLRSDDGGNNWNYVVTSAAVLINEYGKQHPGQQLRRNGEQFEVATSDSDNWQTLTYQRSPAIWYWVACSYFLLLALGIATRKRQVQESTVQTVADILASDRPLRPGDPDPLQFGAIARGLSRFMRNPKTEPPLTVAITGAWGTGKSSLMNLLHHDLKSYGFTPVWFNAWHHQKGEQLLASLYANIRNQAVPGWFSWSRGVPVGLLFRLNILFRRSRKNLLISLLLILLFTAATVYLQLDMKDDYPGWISDKFFSLSRAGDLDSLLVVLFGNLAPLLAALRALRAFGLNPENLMAAAGNDPKASNRMDPNARQRFAREFNDVSSSLELGRMVIFIDDLDRCRQENVVDILEAVNFLAVSGDCYIVIGMDEKWVRICIEQQFSQMVELGQSGKAFSENYLEKLINIKVPVPTLESDASSRLLAPEEPPVAESVPLQRLRQWCQTQWHRYRYLLWMLSIALVGIVAGKIFYLLAERLGPDWPRQAQPEAEPIALQQWDNITLQPQQLEGGQLSFVVDFNSTANNSNKSTDNTLQLRLQAHPDDLKRGVSLGHLGNTNSGLELVLGMATAPTPKADIPEKEDITETADKQTGELKTQEYISGQPSHYSSTEVLLAAAVLLLMACAILYYLLKRQTRIVSDSSKFRNALNLWHPWIMVNRQTPRAIKRYLNRVRYIAMRYRSEDTTPEPSLWRRLLTQKLTTVEETPMDEEFIDEAQLVALSAIFSVDESWLGNEEKFKLLVNGNLSALLSQKFDPKKIGIDDDTSAWQALATQLQEALDNHVSEYSDSFLQQDARRKFLKVVTATAFS
jgi:photosystem II stability/assembly factor-like uncharacterized protein/ABC-type multidrug transport system fused ATPase/permease subunit